METSGWFKTALFRETHDDVAPANHFDIGLDGRELHSPRDIGRIGDAELLVRVRPRRGVSILFAVARVISLLLVRDHQRVMPDDRSGEYPLSHFGDATHGRLIAAPGA
jgi:hypothetical protein